MNRIPFPAAGWCLLILMFVVMGGVSAEELTGRPLIEPAPTGVRFEEASLTMEDERLLIQLDEDATICVRARPLPGEQCSRFMQRLLVRYDSCARIKPYRIEAEGGLHFKLPFTLLKPSLQRRILINLFPQDELGPNSWQHICTYVFEDGGGETLYRIAQWFTGDGANEAMLATFNGLGTDQLAKAQAIRIPQHMLLPHLRHGWVEENEQVGELTYHRDTLGPYARYRLKKGEAIYSAVILRFTDLLQYNDVMEAAEQVARRSGIKDVTDIPVGFDIKIPLELISVRNLPLSSPLRLEYERDLRESKMYRKERTARNLDNVVVLLDTGHGGIDPGAVGCCGISEHEYAYDIACRIKQVIETGTKGSVRMLVEDPECGCSPRDAADLPRNCRELLMTTPPYDLGDATIGVNLRWALANRIFTDIRGQGVPEEQVVFISLHADSLHPTVRGAMFYYPGAAYRKESSVSPASSLKGFAECRDARYRYTRSSKLRAERLSLELSRKVMESLARNKIEIHEQQPIRGYISRSGRRFAPAVLKYCAVPTAVLIETVNLRNREDCSLMQQHQFRQNFARAVVDGLINYFESNDGRSSP
ncbi:N-acetylmuramoyl-L-alanine amidase [bacterium]|nr:N-acetylmuramoyl-L-alanine amidase [candidate division CSSED10-310 bacterium]